MLLLFENICNSYCRTEYIKKNFKSFSLFMKKVLRQQGYYFECVASWFNTYTLI